MPMREYAGSLRLMATPLRVPNLAASMKNWRRLRSSTKSEASQTNGELRPQVSVILGSTSMYAFWSYSAIHCQGIVVQTNVLLSLFGWLAVSTAYAK